MKEIFRLCSCLVNCTFFIHIGELLVWYFFVEFLIELPNHPVDLSVCHLNVHFFENFSNLLFGKILATVRSGELFENLNQVLLLCLINLVLLKFLFNGLFFFSFSFLYFLNVKIVFFGFRNPLFLEKHWVFVFALEMHRQVF